MDKVLALFYRRIKITELELHSIEGIEDIRSCLTFLTKEDYLSRNLLHGNTALLQITPRGRAFHENGGYAAHRNYNQEILDISRKTLWFAKYGFWVAIVSAAIAIVAIILAL